MDLGDHAGFPRVKWTAAAGERGRLLSQKPVEWSSTALARRLPELTTLRHRESLFASAWALTPPAATIDLLEDAAERTKAVVSVKTSLSRTDCTVGDVVLATSTATNTGDKDLHLLLEWRGFSTRRGLRVQGLAHASLGNVPARGGTATVVTSFLAVEPGLHRLDRAVAVDADSAREFTLPSLASVFVRHRSVDFPARPGTVFRARKLPVHVVRDETKKKKNPPAVVPTADALVVVGHQPEPPQIDPPPLAAVTTAIPMAAAFLPPPPPDDRPPTTEDNPSRRGHYDQGTV
mmetsp:Transcript_8084/g.24976  ORF Transcript_8084/g.24976 Transcript_8084/m.24976 type:complete len:291 (+) Transcript_8084:140-1012(+)